MPTLRSALTSATFLMLLACRAKPAETSPETETEGSDGSAEWQELGDGDGDGGTKDDGGTGASDTGKDGYRACGADVIEGAPCEGSWEDSLCVDGAGTFWWCEGGVWTADKDR